MDAAPPEQPRPAQPRAVGEVVLEARIVAGRTRLARLRQAGSLKALFPRASGPALEAVTLNTAGGLTGGDRMALAARAGEGARLVLTTQAAERAYRAAAGAARVEAALSVCAGARIDWLPQETILYEGCRLERSLRVDLEGDGVALLVEPILFGRLARGEALRAAHVRDRWEVRRDGRLDFADALALSGDVHALLDRAAVGGGARAMATVLLAAPAAEAWLRPARALVAGPGGASLIRDGVLLARLLAADGFALRARLVPLILALTGSALPKVWSL